MQSQPKPAEARLERTGRYLVYLAAERSLLAWVRAGVTLMALGFVVDRFGIFLRTALGPGAKAAWSLRLGLLILLLGVLVNGFAAACYLHFVRLWECGREDVGHGIRAAVVVAALLALLGAGLTFYLWSLGV